MTWTILMNDASLNWGTVPGIAGVSAGELTIGSRPAGETPSFQENSGFYMIPNPKSIQDASVPRNPREGLYRSESMSLLCIKMSRQGIDIILSIMQNEPGGVSD
jgi:hypothetical protein